MEKNVNQDITSSSLTNILLKSLQLQNYCYKYHSFMQLFLVELLGMNVITCPDGDNGCMETMGQ